VFTCACVYMCVCVCAHVRAGEGKRNTTKDLTRARSLAKEIVRDIQGCWLKLLQSLQCIVLQVVAVCCSVLQCVAVFGSVLAVCCSV